MYRDDLDRSNPSEILRDGLNSGSTGHDPSSEERRIRQALSERPKFSVKARLTLILLVFFVVSAVIAVAAMVMLSKIDDRVRFVSLTDKFANEIQSARRGEKNFLLYNTDLTEVRAHVDSATAIFEQAAMELGHVVGREELGQIRIYLTRYSDLVDTLLARDQAALQPDTLEFQQTAQSLRTNGSRILELSLDVSRQERLFISNTITTAKRVQIGLLVVLLLFSIFLGSYMSRHIISRLNRLMNATQQFASGNFLPITPRRKYKDEFSHLVIALNHMMYELDRRQELLVESHKLRAIGNLTAGVAHELNNPLNNIILTADMMKEGYGELSDEEIADMIDDLVTQGQRARQVVKNLLDFARESETTAEHLHVDRLIEETISLAKNQIRLSKIALDQDVPGNLPPIYGDRKLLVQVLLNLVLNAIDAMPNGGELTVRVEQEKKTGFLSVIVSDTGCGISSHILGSIFTPFFTTKPTGKGTGLGLAVSQGIIQKHGGSIEVDSKVGEGTTFIVHLPIVPIPAHLGD